jgi:hypothetical protein
MSDLYETDILIWSEQQADELRHLQQAGLTNAVDWQNLIEEVLAVGRSELHAVESLLQRAIEHLLKAAGWPEAQDTSHWMAESHSFLARARRRYTPSMAQRIDLSGIYVDALHVVRLRRYDGTEPALLPEDCPLALEDLLYAQVDVAELAKRLRER